jgi:uncharacterized protein YceK
MRTALVSLSICSVLASGCGTFSDAMCGPISDNVFYRGVLYDVLAVKEGGPLVLMAADIPFSMVADTLLLPYIAYLVWIEPRTISTQTDIDESANSNKPMVDPQTRSELNP